MLEVFKFECRYQLRSPLFLTLSSVFFLLAFLLMASENISLGGVGNATNLNAAWTIVFTQFFFSMIGMLAAISIVSQAITRDYELQTAEILFSTGVSEKGFLLGRYAAGCLFGTLVGVSAILGTMFATFMPWLDQERVGAFSLDPYLYSLFIVTIPNFFFTSALFFTVAALTRSMIAAFASAVGFFVLNIVIGALADPEDIQIYALFDPFGSTAFSEVSRYWTVFERNTELVPIAGNMLANRLLFVGVGIFALVMTVWRYRFTLNASPFARWRRKTKQDPAPAVISDVTVTVRPSSWLQFKRQLRTDMQGIFKSVPFYAVLGFALINVWGGFSFATGAFGIDLFPTTSAIIRVVAGAYSIFVLMIVIYYSGELVHRERQTGVSEVMDAMPFANGVMITSKIVALWLIIFALYAVAALAGILMQLFSGYTNLELDLYAGGLFGIQASQFYSLAVLAVFVQVLAGNKWFGMALMLVVFILFASMGSFGFEHALYNFGIPGGMPIHSDMNGYGHYLTPYYALAGYWSAFCVLLVIVAHVFYQRGRVVGLGERVSVAKGRLSQSVVFAAGAATVAFVAIGVWVFYNTNIINTYIIADEVELRQANYEKAYKQYELMDHLEPIAVDTEVDLFPDDRRIDSRGTIKLVNVLDTPIDELFISTHLRLSVNELVVPGAERIEHNPEMGVHRYRFASPIQPGQELDMTFDATWDHEGFENFNVNSTVGSYNRVVENGTFVNNTEIFPTIGYNRGLELGDPNERREYGLEPIVRLPKIDDPDWINRSQLGFTRRTDFRTRFSTSADQIAVAPGYLVGEVEESEGRRIYTYEMDAPIWPFFSFTSARYEVARDNWNDVVIEVYHHPEHDYNVESMIRGTKKSLAYFSEHFSPYQYRQFRILEFPRYASFAQAFPNTIPFSEAIGFVADLTDEHALDMVFYVTAHEAAHQWWGHQVAGAQVQGMTVIVETLAQYSALMVMEDEYGKDKMRRFLRYELDNYLGARGSEQIEELPLVLSENQAYIHYRKGSLVMYALQDLIGEDRVNLSLRNFLDKFAYGTGPFPTARDLVAEFRAVAGPEHQELITDLFENITLYDFGVEEVAITERDGGYEVKFSTTAKKYYAEGDGRETETEMDTWVDIAVFPEDVEELEDYQLPQPIFIEKRRVTGGEEVVLFVEEKPHRVGIDPYNKLIDRNPENNLKLI